MKRIFTTGLFLLIILHLSAQKIVLLDELNFHSDFEKFAFNDLEKSTSFDLLFAVNPSTTKKEKKSYQKQLTDFYSILEKKNVRKKKTKRAVRTILWQVRKHFLKEYKENALFHQVFKDGIYNCVTASAIYALTLEHFNIPYEIRELPTHTYIVVAPQTENIILESTDSLGSLYAIQQANFIRNIAKAKLIKETEISKNSVDNLYYKYMADEERTIDVKGLAGNLYYNESLQNLKEQSYLEALNLINKSLYLPPRPNAQYAKISAQLELASKANVENYQSLKYVFDLLEYKAYRSATENNIKYYNHQITKKYLIDDFDKNAYLERHDYLVSQLDTVQFLALYNEIQILHFKQLDYADYLREEVDTSMNYLNSAYQIAPNDLVIQNLIMEEITLILIDTRYEKRENRLNTYRKKFPFIEERSEVADISLKIAAHKVKRAFNTYNLEEGLQYLEIFKEKLEETKANKNAQNDAIGIAYASIYDYYLDKMDNETAKKWLEKGLRKAPKSSELLKLKASFDRYQKRLSGRRKN
jgi:hypothetical protein